MDNEEFSVIVRFRLNPQTNAMQLQVVDVATGAEVLLNETSFLLHISIRKQALITRCYIRHITSGDKVYVQGSTKLRTFIKAHLLKEGPSTSE